MTEDIPELPETGAESAPEKPAVNPIQKWTIRILIIAFAYFVWYLIADRITPSTSEARISGHVVPIAAQVSGEVVDVSNKINSLVKAGEAILQINRRDFELAVTSAEAELELAGQELGAGTASIASAQAALTSAEANYKSIKSNSVRIFEMEKRGVIPQSDGDRTRGKLGQAEAQVASAKAELKKAKVQLGASGLNNPRIRAAMAALEQARINLERTVVRAPADGGVTSMKLGEGHYARAGDPLLTFVATDGIWVEAYMRENNLSNIQPGNKVELVLDVAPGRIYKGEVVSVGFGVTWDQKSQAGKLPSIKGSAGWMREPQRFPVIIQFSDQSAKGLRREGGQADVIIYTGDGFIMNTLAKLSIRIKSIISYLS